VRRATLVLLLAVGGCEPADIGRSAASLAPPPPDAPSATFIALPIDPSAARAEPDGPTYHDDAWHFGTSTGWLRFPAPVQVGDTIVEWRVHLQRDQVGPTATAMLAGLDAYDGQRMYVLGELGGIFVDGTSPPGYVSIGDHAYQFVDEDHSFAICLHGGSVPGDRVVQAMVYVLRPGA
jgi:hypothetical protein